jgi:hypothetical protein
MQQLASSTSKKKRTCLPCVARCSCAFRWGGDRSTRTKNWQRALCQFFVRAEKTKAPETSVAERLGDRGSAGTSDCRTVSRHTVPVTSHPRVRGTHPGYRPHSLVPGQLERETQVQGPMGNLHLRGHSLWPGTWEGREGCFCNSGKLNAFSQAFAGKRLGYKAVRFSRRNRATLRATGSLSQ